jgi:hypothetical protein
LKPAWVKHTIYQGLFDTALGGLEAARLSCVGPPDQNELARIESIIWKQDRPGQRLFSLAGFREVAPDLVVLVNDEGTIAHRLLQEAADILTGSEAALRHISVVEMRFDRLLSRAERQRNTIIHGYRPPQGVISNVDAFLATLGSYASRDLFRYLVGDDPAKLPLQRERQAFEQGKGLVEDGAGLVPSLFPEETDPAGAASPA